MARYALGQPVRLSTTVKDLTGALVDAGTLSLTLRRPDATNVIYAAPTHPGIGTYYQDVPAADITVAGHYQYVWTSTGIGAGAIPGSFDTYDPFEGALLSLEDARAQLNMTSTANDAELRDMVAATAACVDFFCGPVAPRTLTEVHGRRYLGSWEIVVDQPPLISVTSIVSQVSGGPSYLPGDLLLIPDSGIIQLGSGGYFYGRLAVTYVAGRAIIPPSLNLAARLILQHMWKTQRGPAGRPNLGGDDSSAVAGLGYSIPNRAIELMATAPRPPAVA
jgi:hypothetical protein